MAQGVIHQHKGQHGFGNWRRADADTGIVPAFGGHLYCIAVNVDRAPRLGNRRGGFDGHADDDILTGRYAAENPSGVVADEAPRCHFVAVLAAAPVSYTHLTLPTSDLV